MCKENACKLTKQSKVSEVVDFIKQECTFFNESEETKKASLIAIDTLEKWGKLVGAILFSLGIFAIVTYELRLFTGMVADIPKMGIKNTWKLPVCFLGNIFGVGIVALLVYCTPLSTALIRQSEIIAANKLGAKNWALSAFCSSIFWYASSGVVTPHIW